MADLKTIVPELQSALERKQLDAANELLSRAKRALLVQNALIPTPSTPPQLVALARQVLELGAIASIRQTDAQTFTRYYQQLQPFYDLERDAGVRGQSPSDVDFSTSQRSKITGLYLLLLLSMGDSANFHTVLEGLVEEASLKGGRIEDNPHIKYPVELERNLMEGSYDKVWRETKSERVPSEDFGLFSNVSDALNGTQFESVIDIVSVRSLSAPSAAKSQTARRRPIPPFLSRTLRTCSSWNPKVPLLSLLGSVAGSSAMAGYTFPSSRRRPRGLRRTSWWPVAQSLKIHLATPESWRRLFECAARKAFMDTNGYILFFWDLGCGCTCILAVALI